MISLSETYSQAGSMASYVLHVSTTVRGRRIAYHGVIYNGAGGRGRGADRVDAPALEDRFLELCPQHSSLSLSPPSPSLTCLIATTTPPTPTPSTRQSLTGSPNCNIPGGNRYLNYPLVPVTHGVEFVCPGFVHNSTCGYAYRQALRVFAQTRSAGSYHNHAATRGKYITECSAREI